MKTQVPKFTSLLCSCPPARQRRQPGGRPRTGRVRLVARRWRLQWSRAENMGGRRHQTPERRICLGKDGHGQSIWDNCQEDLTYLTHSIDGAPKKLTPGNYFLFRDGFFFLHRVLWKAPLQIWILIQSVKGLDRPFQNWVKTYPLTRDSVRKSTDQTAHPTRLKGKVKPGTCRLIYNANV